ncbi:MAG TPA: energy-coupling factor ABC transporter ATP-binding protein [Pseudogracilibacillus sp.]|nr:energy-coupling factor ABC transporter ATP-binding protein [Pseudogracilibacillus sp.]
MEITFKNVGYTYQAGSPFSHQALNDVSFHITSGSFVAIIGHTGSGKSTLIQHLNGLTLPTEGTVQVGSFALSKANKPKNMKELRSKVGAVFQYPEHQLFEETVAKDIAFGPTNFGVSQAEIDRRIKAIVPLVGLQEELLERSPFELSGGQMRRVAIAGVLATKPEVFVLDEPTAGLDPRGQKEIMDMFYNIHQTEKVTTILVTHSMEDALKYADHVIILNKGEVYMEGKPDEVLLKTDSLRKVNLDIPESILFLKNYIEHFSLKEDLSVKSITELADFIKATYKGNDL